MHPQQIERSLALDLNDPAQLLFQCQNSQQGMSIYKMVKLTEYLRINTVFQIEFLFVLFEVMFEVLLVSYHVTQKTAKFGCIFLILSGVILLIILGKKYKTHKAEIFNLKLTFLVSNLSQTNFYFSWFQFGFQPAKRNQSSHLRRTELHNSSKRLWIKFNRLITGTRSNTSAYLLLSL